MLSTILSAFTVAEIRKKLLFTAMILALYRVGAHIPVPGVSLEAVNGPCRSSSAAAASSTC